MNRFKSMVTAFLFGTTSGRLLVAVAFAAIIGGLTKAADMINVLDLDASTAAFVTAILVATIQFLKALEQKLGEVKLSQLLGTQSVLSLGEILNTMFPTVKGEGPARYAGDLDPGTAPDEGEANDEDKDVGIHDDYFSGSHIPHRP